MNWRCVSTGKVANLLLNTNTILLFQHHHFLPTNWAILFLFVSRLFPFIPSPPSPFLPTPWNPTFKWLASTASLPRGLSLAELPPRALSLTELPPRALSLTEGGWGFFIEFGRDFMLFGWGVTEGWGWGVFEALILLNSAISSPVLDALLDLQNYKTDYNFLHFSCTYDLYSFIIMFFDLTYTWCD